jgi:hypothetical protein
LKKVQSELEALKKERDTIASKLAALEKDLHAAKEREAAALKEAKEARESASARVEKVESSSDGGSEKVAGLEKELATLREKAAKEKEGLEKQLAELQQQHAKEQKEGKKDGMLIVIGVIGWDFDFYCFSGILFIYFFPSFAFVFISIVFILVDERVISSWSCDSRVAPERPEKSAPTQTPESTPSKTQKLTPDSKKGKKSQSSTVCTAHSSS